MSKKGYLFTCFAVTYQGRHGQYKAGFSMKVSADDPRAGEFINNPAWKCEPEVDIPTKETKSDNSTDKVQSWEDAVGTKFTKILKEAGLDTPEKIAEAGSDTLITIKGIADKAAEKILASIKPFIKTGSEDN